MDRPRFSWAWLIVMVVPAFALAPLRAASTCWNSVATRIALVLAWADLAAVLFRRWPGRAFWAGFAGFGWVDLLLIYRHWNGAQIDHGATGSFGALDDFVFPDPRRPASGSFGRIPARLSGGPAHIDQLQWRTRAIGNFMPILSDLFCFVRGLDGGISARVFVARAESRRNA